MSPKCCQFDKCQAPPVVQGEWLRGDRGWYCEAHFQMLTEIASVREVARVA